MTISRLDAVHAWPVFCIRPEVAALTVAAMSSASSTMNGSLPPSSSTDFFRCLPARAPTELPARSLPVSVTPWMRGSAMTCSTSSMRRNVLVKTPSGAPASVNSCSMATAHCGVISACLRITVLPSTRFGPATRTTW